ncbi:hypothetical protein VPH35_001840 [Triticum aestivum]
MRPMTGRRSRPSRSASRSFPVTGSLKIKTGHIVLVMSGWRYCGLMSLEQSDPSKICAKILGVKGIVVVRSMSPASARHGVHSPKEQGFKAGQQASLDESISLLKQSTAEINAQVSLDTKDVCRSNEEEKRKDLEEEGKTRMLVHSSYLHFSLTPIRQWDC